MNPKHRNNPSGMTQAQQQVNLVQAARPGLIEASNRLFTPFAQIPARNVLKHLPGDVAEAVVLLLGCADGSCLLASLAKEYPELQRLIAVLDDHNPLQLAKAALLLLLASELDPNSRDDMQVLWEVWYCALWTPATLTRVKPYMEGLRAEKVPWLVIPRQQDRDALLFVWGSWLKTDQPSGAKVAKLREDLRARMDANIGAGRKKAVVDCALGMTVKPGSVELATYALSQALGGVKVAPVKDETLPKGAVTLEGILQQDQTTFCDSGYLAPNYSGQQAAKPRSANVTMLRPWSPSWRCNVDTSPVFAWGPFSAAELESAIKSGSAAGLMARLCIARITELVRAFQAHMHFGSQPARSSSSAAVSASAGAGTQHTRARTSLQVQLVCMDALQLCLTLPLTETASSAKRQPAQKQQREQATGQLAEAHAAKDAIPAPPLLFDAIDASTTADSLGLLPLLVAAGARLKQAPHARLFTSVRRWFASDTLEDFICKRMLHMAPSLMPAMLGMRLLTDLSPEQPETSEAQDYASRPEHFRELMWAPIPAELQAKPLPFLKPQLSRGPPGSMEAALHAVITRLCCVTKQDRNDSSTPQLLAWLLAYMTQRVDMSALLDSGSSSASISSVPADSAKYATTQRLLWALRTKVVAQLPAHLRMCFITGLDVLRSSLQQNAPADWQPADVPLCRGVLQLTVPWPMPVGTAPAREEETRAVFVDMQTLRQQPHSRKGSTDAVTFKDVAAWATSGAAVPAGVHITDMWASGRCVQIHWAHPTEENVYVYLPVDHGLDPAQTQVYLCGIEQQAKLQHLLPGKIIQAPPVLAQVLLPAACPVTAATHISSSCEEQPSDKPWVLRAVALEEDAECYQAYFEVQANTTDGPARAYTSLQARKVKYYANGQLLVSSPFPDDAFRDLRQRSTAHQLIVDVGDHRVQPAELRLCWPMAIGLNETDWVLENAYSGFYQMATGVNASEMLTVKMQKAKVWELWPSDKAWRMAPDSLDLVTLSPLPERASSILGLCGMEQYHRKIDYESGSPKGSSLNSLRFMLEGLMNAVGEQKPSAAGGGASSLCFIARAHEQLSGWGGLEQVQETKVYIRVYPPILITPAGRPVLPCTVVDMCLCEGATAKGFLPPATLDRLLQRLGFTDDSGPNETGVCCQTLRRFLGRRAHACQPCAAQRQALPDGNLFPYYYNSYVSFTQCLDWVGYLRPVPASQMAELHMSGTRKTHLHYRVDELLAQFIPGKPFQHYQSIADELKLLLEQDGGRALPMELKAKVQMFMNYWDQNSEDMREALQPQVQTASSARTGTGASTQLQDTHAAGAAAAGSGCAFCGKQEVRLSACGKCRSVQYCSRECQVAHWKEHKGVCKAHQG